MEFEFTVTVLNGAVKANEKGATLEMGTCLVFSSEARSAMGASLGWWR